MRLHKFFQKFIPNFQIIDVKAWFDKGFVEVYIKKADDNAPTCHKCETKLKNISGRHRLRLKSFNLLKLQTYYCVWRRKGYCPYCKKHRSEYLEILCPDSPHLEKEYAESLGELTEFAAVNRVASYVGVDKSTLFRVDLRRLKRLIQYYRIPDVERVCVDEVHAKSNRFSREPRHKQFFTIISDMDTGKVIWVSENREKAALDQFYILLGKERCAKIKVVTMDQYVGYKSSTEEYCPNAVVVWDRFHLIRNFEEALNMDRIDIVDKNEQIKSKLPTRFRYLFLKRANNRTSAEKRSLKSAMKLNENFYKLELIKEKFFRFFNQRDVDDAQELIVQLKEWINEGEFYYLKKWVDSFIYNWDTVKNYFKYRVTNAMAEGLNNVIKKLKGRSYGFRNMDYFKLKILQNCGYLSSKYIKINTYE